MTVYQGYEIGKYHYGNLISIGKDGKCIGWVESEKEARIIINFLLTSTKE